MIAAKIENLTLAFQGITKALHNISFCLKPRETLCLLGESGCGKSLTALALMRLLPEDVYFSSKSSINVDGIDILDITEAKMRKLRGNKLAVIFQEPLTALNPVLTIKQQLSEAILQIEKLRRVAIQTRMVELLAEVELPEKILYTYPHQLSGGQKQRVVIACALASNPKILIADEPTTALDVTIQAQILKLLKKLQEKHSMSLLLITHDLGVVKKMADRVCVMYAGQIVENSNVADFFAKPQHPYSKALFGSLPSFKARTAPLPVIAGGVPSLDLPISGCKFHTRCQYSFAKCHEIMPKLTTSEGSDEVRCHLDNLAELPVVAPKKWPDLAKPAQPILQVDNLCVSYGKKAKFLAVNKVSFDLFKNRTLALVGESGCGKTTIARTLLSLIKPDSGRILCNGMKKTDTKIQLILESFFCYESTDEHCGYSSRRYGSHRSHKS